MEETLWRTVLGEIELTMSKGNFITWISPSRLLSIDNGVAIVFVPNIFYKERFETHFKSAVLSALQKQVSSLSNVIFTIDKAEGLTEQLSAELKPIDQPLREALETEQSPSPQNQSPPSEISSPQSYSSYPQLRQNTDNSPTIVRRLTFNTFVEGSNNRMAYSAALAISKDPGNRYNPFFIYGGVGLGKTHLMHAIANTILEIYPSKKALYVSCETFTNDYIDSIRARKMDVFKKTYRSVDVLLVDDVQFIANKEGSQEEFFNTFNTLHQSNRQIILAGDRPPTAIVGLEDRLSSRFGWGMVVDIQPANLETRMAILARKAGEKGVILSEDVAEFIATQAQSNIRELEGALNSVLGRCEVLQIPISTEAAKSALSGMYQGASRRGITSDSIISTVSEHFGISVSEICGKKRQNHLVYPRHIAMYVLRDQLGMSYPDIGKAMGGKDHTTVMHAVDKITAGRSQTHISQDLDAIRAKLV